MSGDLLDRNLRALLTRSYVPAQPAPAFRDALTTRFLDEHERLTRSGAEPTPASSAPRGTLLRFRWVAAAAALLLATLFLRGLFDGPTVEEILARGEIALRHGDGPWTSHPSQRSLEASDEPTEIAVPAERELDVLFGSGAGGRVTLEGPARARLAESGRTAVLESGGLRSASGTAAAPQVRLSFQGRTTFVLDGDFRVELILPTELATARERQLATSLLLGDSDRRIGLVEVPGAGAARFGARPLAPGRTLLSDRGARALDEEPVGARDGEDEVAGLPGEPGETGGSEDAGAGGRTEVVVTGPDGDGAEEAADEALERPGIRGRVTNTDGEPVTTFRLTLLPQLNLPDIGHPSWIDVRDSDGRFAWAEVDGGRYRVFVESEGYGTFRRSDVMLADEGLPVELDVRLDRGARIRGYVVDENGDPIEGAWIVSERDFPGQLLPATRELARSLSEAGVDFDFGTTSASDGSFELGPLSAGEQILRASIAGRSPRWSKKLGVEVGELVSDVVLELAPAGGVRGTVTDADGAPRGGLQVFATFADYSGVVDCLTFGTDRTAADGSYSVPDLPAGFVTVVLLEELSDSAEPRISFAVVTEGEWSEVDFADAPPGGRVEGRVVTPPTKSVEGLGLMIAKIVPGRGPDMDESWSAVSLPADGRFSFDGLGPATYGVFLSSGAKSNLVQIDTFELVEPGQQVQHDIRLGLGEIRGRVTAAGDGATLPHSVVILTQANTTPESMFGGKTMADENGEYAFEFLPPGRYYVVAYSARAEYGQELSDEIVIEADRPHATVDFELFPGGSLKLLVRDAGGEPLAGAQVAITDQDDNTYEFSPTPYTGEDGTYEVHGVTAGPMTVRISIGGRVVARELVEIVPEQTVELEVELPTDSPR